MNKGELSQQFRRAAEDLLAASDVSPRNTVAERAVLGLVDLAIHHPEVVAEEGANMSGDTLPRLRAKFLEADREMEKYWAGEILESGGEALSWDHFNLYPWFEDYPALLDFEKRAIENVAGPITKDTTITYIGSGALPIIPLMLHEQTGCQIDCVDINDGAVSLSRRIIEGLGMESGVRVHKGEGQTLPVNTRPDVLFLANAPLGSEEAMVKIVRDIRPGVVFARSSSGGTAMLYPSVDEGSLAPAGYTLAHLAQDHAHNTHTGFVYRGANGPS